MKPKRAEPESAEEPWMNQSQRTVKRSYAGPNQTDSDFDFDEYMLEKYRQAARKVAQALREEELGSAFQKVEICRFL